MAEGLSSSSVLQPPGWREELEALQSMAGADCPKLVTILTISEDRMVFSPRSKREGFLETGILWAVCLSAYTSFGVPSLGSLPSPVSPLSFAPPLHTHAHAWPAQWEIGANSRAGPVGYRFFTQADLWMAPDPRGNVSGWGWDQG